MRTKTLRTLSTLTTALLIFMGIFAFAACEKDADTANVSCSVIVIHGESVQSYEATMEGSVLQDLLDTLADDGLTYSTETSAYGSFITAINSVSAGSGEFWAIYKSINDDEALEEYTYSHESVTYYSASKGILELKLKDGEVYVFVLSAY